MTTCRDIITLGLQLGRVVGVGRTPRASEAATGLEVLQGMYDGMVANGMFGRLTDGGRLTVDLDDKDESKTEVLLDIQPLPKKEGKSKPEEATAG